MSAAAPRPYVNPGPGYPPGPPQLGGEPSSWLNLALNESQFGPSPKVAAAVNERVARIPQYAWPAATDLRRAIGVAHGVDPDLIVCGNGSEDVIDNIVRTFCRVGDDVVGPAFTWAGFAQAVQRQGARLVEAPLTAGHGTDVDALLAAVTPQTKVLFVANPHNPLGGYVPVAEIQRLHRALPSHILLLLDAAYAELATAPDYSAGHELVGGNANVVVTRTLSKVYGLAGARTGWVHAPKPICDALNAMRQMSNVPSLVEAAAIAAVSDRAHVADVARRNAAVRAAMTQQLTDLGLEVIPSQTNFVAVRFPGAPGRTAAEVAASMMTDGILVSRLAHYDMPDWLRITMPTEKDLDRVVRSVVRGMGRNS